MIASLPLSDPTPIDSFVDDGALVEYRVDADAEPGRMVPILARLLIDLRRKQNEADDDDAK